MLLAWQRNACGTTLISHCDSRSARARQSGRDAGAWVAAGSPARGVRPSSRSDGGGGGGLICGHGWQPPRCRTASPC
eukprot:365530-Chlamydomonas_euryale.AAC.30